MALFIRQDDQRSKLQERLAAELREKARLKSEAENNNLPDGVNDSEFLKGSRQTSRFAWVWIVVIIVVALAVIWLTTLGTKS